MHVVLVGLGNIGSHAVPLLAPLSEISRLTLIDMDRYESANLAGQAIHRADLRKPKALVQENVARRLRGDLEVTAIFEDVTKLPLWTLACDVLLSAVDSRAVRQSLNEMCWTLGVPWIDSGVNAAHSAIRITAFAPGENNACLECSWDQRHYKTLEATYPCQAGTPTARTNAPASLGALAAAMLVIECAKMLRGEREKVAIGRQVVLDAAWHRHHVGALERNPLCRFSHQTLPVASAPILPLTATIGELFQKSGGAALRVAHAGNFAKQASCGRCGWKLRAPRLVRGLRCPRCRRALKIPGFYTTGAVQEADFTDNVRKWPLTRLGLLPGDVVVVESEENSHCVLIGESHD